MPVRHFGHAEVRSGRRAMEVPLFLTVFLAAAMFALAEGSLLFLLLSWVAVVVHMVAAERHCEVYAHRMVLNLGVVLVGVALTIRFLTSDQDLLIALGHYVTLIQLCKLFERKRDRDYIQMLVMSLLLVLAATMICQEMLFALLGLVYLACLCYTATVFTMKRTVWAAARREEAAAGDAPSPRSTEKAWPTRAVLSRLGVAVLAILATGVVVFLVSPRAVGGPGAPLRRVRGESVSGFSDTVRLGEPRSIYLSDRVMMNVRALSPEGRNLGAVGKLYLRGRAYTEYVDSRWVHSTGPVRYLGMPAPAAFLRRAVRQEVAMVPSLLPTAFASYPAIKLTSPDANVRKRSGLEYELKASRRTERPVEYTALVLPGPYTEAELDHLARAEGRLGRRSPPPEQAPNVPRTVSDLARRWCADLLARRAEAAEEAERARLDLAIAERIGERLRQRCTYTLDLTEADATRDGVEDFLFHLRRGHCEYFASALTVMCRAVGLRARLATGFCPGEFDDEAMHYVVRQRDAHAWTEVYTPRTDWQVVDATPAARFEPPEERGLSGWWAGARDTWRQWEFTWYAHVIGYDDDARRRLASRWRGHVLAVWQAVRAAAREVYWGLVDLFARGRVSLAVVWFFVGVALVAGTIAAGLLLPRRRWRRRARRKLHAPRPPAFLVQLLALLRRHGVGDEPGCTPRELAERAAAQLPLPAETLEELIALYYGLRWGAQAPDRDTLRAAEGQVRRLAELLST